jgi:hypothetical protein
MKNLYLCVIPAKEGVEKRIFAVIPAKAGIHKLPKLLDSRFRGNDGQCAPFHFSTLSKAGIPWLQVPGDPRFRGDDGDCAFFETLNSDGKAQC